MSQVQVPQLCQSHQVHLVTRLRLGPDDPWRAAMVVNALLMFQRASQDNSIHARTGGDIGQLSLVLAEIGCLACRYPEDFSSALSFQHEADGKRVADVIHARVSDPRWPWGLAEKLGPR